MTDTRSRDEQMAELAEVEPGTPITVVTVDQKDKSIFAFTDCVVYSVEKEIDPTYQVRIGVVREEMLDSNETGDDASFKHDDELPDWEIRVSRKHANWIDQFGASPHRVKQVWKVRFPSDSYQFVEPESRAAPDPDLSERVERLESFKEKVEKMIQSQREYEQNRKDGSDFKVDDDYEFK